MPVIPSGPHEERPDALRRPVAGASHGRGRVPPGAGSERRPCHRAVLGQGRGREAGGCRGLQSSRLTQGSVSVSLEGCGGLVFRPRPAGKVSGHGRHAGTDHTSRLGSEIPSGCPCRGSQLPTAVACMWGGCCRKGKRAAGTSN